MANIFKTTLLIAVVCCASGCSDDSTTQPEAFKSYSIKSVKLLDAPLKSMDDNGIETEYDNDSGPDVYFQIKKTVDNSRKIIYTSETFNNSAIPASLPLAWLFNTPIVVDDFNNFISIEFLDEDINSPEVSAHLGTIRFSGESIRGKTSAVISDTLISKGTPVKKAIIQAELQLQWNK